eukprot:430787-Pleurochrysis_carterae.AAC.1
MGAEARERPKGAKSFAETRSAMLKGAKSVTETRSAMSKGAKSVTETRSDMSKGALTSVEGCVIASRRQHGAQVRRAWRVLTPQ